MKDYLIDIKLGDGGRCQIGVENQANEVAACNKVEKLLRKSNILKVGEDFKITWCRERVAKTQSQEVVEGMAVVLLALAIPVVGVCELLTILG
ncbi:MAG: hypothetical protein QM496_01815 [Verrucomicrobiota bacterium]